MSSSEVLQPGEELTLDDLPRYRLKSLYERRYIGVKDDDWTEYMLEAFLGQLQDEAEEAETHEVIVEHIGGGVHTLTIGGIEVERVKGGEAAAVRAEEWLNLVNSTGEEDDDGAE